jgi:peptidoglycan/LPS O-acetylase OafA/YrhL
MANKLVELEAVRGIAAGIVLLHHFTLTFLPHLHGRNFPDDPIALVRTPLFALVNGSAAVAVFFVLSGFVLTVRAFEDGGTKRLIIGIFKRWPRLIPAVLAANLFSAILLAAGLYLHLDRVWFEPTSYGSIPGVFTSAIKEGVYSTFFNGDAAFNTSIWTMHYELVGSILCYLTALAMLSVSDLRSSLIIGGLSMLTISAIGPDGVVFATLVIGVLIARAYVSGLPLFRWPILLPMICAIFFCAGYDGYSRPVGFYAFIQPYATPGLEHVIHAIGAALTILLVLLTPPLRRLLAGKTGLWLGRLSFPVYLVHWPILMGIVFHLHGWLMQYGAVVAIPIAFGCFIGLTLVCALPLVILDEWWVAALAEKTRRCFGVRLGYEQSVDK